MNKQEQIELINGIQDEYVNKLEEKIRYKIAIKDELNVINFGSDTGTGKSVMISKLINNCKDLFFVITTLSRGGLNRQLGNTLNEKCHNDNFICYGSCDLTANTKKDVTDILKEISVKNSKCSPIIWLRDEGHIKTNIFSNVFKNKIAVIVNISATNVSIDDIRCNFSDTLLLRHPELHMMAHFDDAIEKLLEIKEAHKHIKGYNPCMVVRCLDESVSNALKLSAQSKGLKCVDLNEDNIDTLSVCDDDNEYDVIINKMKIIEGVDIRRCHVEYIQNNIGKDSTNIQLVGRSRRNALLWRNDIDILAPENKDLLNKTLVSYIYYNNDKGLTQDTNGEFLSVCCNMISVESLRPNSIVHVENGYLPNGYLVYELQNETGDFKIEVDKEFGFNFVSNLPKIYEEVIERNVFNSAHKIDGVENIAYVEGTNLVLYKKDFMCKKFNYATGKEIDRFDGSKYHGNVHHSIMQRILPITEKEFDSGVIKNRFPIFNNYDFISNNKLFAMLSGDTFQYRDTGYCYTPSITTKLTQDSKLRRYIQNKYKDVINNANTFSGKNNFGFDKKCNSCLGYLTEYFTKYLLLGDAFLTPFLTTAIQEVIDLDPDFVFESAEKNQKDKIVIRACHLKYLDMMTRCYGQNIRQCIPSIKVSDIIKENYDVWATTIVELATKTSRFITDNMYYDGKTDPILRCSGIKGICDFISPNVIIDLKTTNSISKSYVEQVLSYYELSKTRNDLHISTIIIYDCVSGKYVKIDNLDTRNYFEV